MTESEPILADFGAAFDNGEMAWEVAPKLGCSEAAAVAGLLRYLGRTEAAGY
ncbi:hypothetical protein ACWIGW_44775 [Nocardia brasiliensis]|uniref:hypothetical protein n=1 Tax=Streptomyces sp. NPDC056056 TaxID=3345698 RepID=UPI0035DB26A8